MDCDFKGRTVGVQTRGSIDLYSDFLAPSSEARSLGLLSEYERKGEAAFDEVYDRGACVLIDHGSNTIHLWRSAMSDRALYWRQHDCGMFAFASLVSLLREPDDALNIAYLASAAAFAWREPSDTGFVAIRRVPAGQVLTVRAGKFSFRRIWDPESILVQEAHDAGAIGAVRSLFDRSVARSVDGIEGAIACQLSAGRDSSAVTAVAAKQVGRERLLAFTAGPTPPYDGPSAGDETDQARATAAQIGVAHAIVRPTAACIAERLDRFTAWNGEPLGNVKALAWWDEIVSEGAEYGARTMLIGALGNYSINSGGLQALPSLLREEGLSAFGARLPTALRDLGFLPTLAILFPRIAEGRLGRMARRILQASVAPARDLVFLRDPLRHAANQARRAVMKDHGFSSDYRKRIAQFLLRADLADPASVLSHDIDLRDPTADRELVEAILSLPARSLCDGPAPRPLFAKLFGDDVPDEVTFATERGIQAADWYLQFPAPELREIVRRYAEESQVGALIDVDAMLAFLERWPTTYAESLPIAGECLDFLNALAVAAFVYWAASTNPS